MTVSGHPRAGSGLGLEGTALLVPKLQSEPLPILPVQPAPCTQTCPAGINVKAYVSLIAERRFAEALEVVRRHCPLPGICGRVCHHPCEAVCLRGGVDEPVAIRSLKRFVADRVGEAGEEIRVAPSPLRSERVAVIGSGPAGLTAAWDLRQAGCRVTVLEAENELGGMLRYGITAYRLPREILDREIEYLCGAGLEIETGCRIGVDLGLDDLMEKGYSATIFALGAQSGRRLGVPGEESCAQVEDALAFLRRVNRGDRSPVQGRVVVIGGGATAVEAARSSLRLGADSVEILYRRYREELLADREEIRAAEAEGIGFRFLVAPVGLALEDGRLRELQCVRVGLGEPDSSGRRSPIHIPGSEFRVPADRVLAAVGQSAELDLLPDDFRTPMSDRGLLDVDPRSSMTRMQGVFAAGDVVSGPATVIEAIAAGHRAAASVLRYFEQGHPEIECERPEMLAATEYGLPDTQPLEAMRLRPELISPAPGREFSEVESPFTEETAVAEARRCLRCGPCGECRICAPSCRRRHLMVRLPATDGEPATTALLRAPGAIAMSLPTRCPTDGKLLPEAVPVLLSEVGAREGRSVEILPVRARIVAERCRGCGLCAEVCPFDAITVTDYGHGISRAAIEPALCRGCNLCHGVCPTEAAIPTALSPEWWGSRLGDAFQAVDDGPEERPYLLLACQRRAGSLEPVLDRYGATVKLIRFRCVGQIDAGMLLELYGLGARAVLVAGCSSERCRFDAGARLAQTQIERARSMLALMGADPDRIRTDWSPDRAGDPLDATVLELMSSAEWTDADVH